MEPDKDTIMPTILAEVLDVYSIEIESYILAHQRIHSRLMKADPQGTTEASIHPAHMSRLSYGLSDDQKITMNYLMSCWEYRSKT